MVYLHLTLQLLQILYLVFPLRMDYLTFDLGQILIATISITS